VARYKDTCSRQGRLIPVQLERQALPGTFEYTLRRLIDERLDLSIFDARYRNDEEGAPAYDPRVLLKIILFAYSRGIFASRKIARCCEENILFMALSGGSRPHFTTIADFVSTHDQEMLRLFVEVLLVCSAMGLIGREMFAIDGVKLPSNASKEWSGTRADFQRKKSKLEEAIRRILAKHREADSREAESETRAREEQYVAKLEKQVQKIHAWLGENQDKPGRTKAALKSNITDNESAKMKSSHGVIQGYDGVAMVDGKHQVIVAAEAFGEAQEHGLLKPMVKTTRENFKTIGTEEDVFRSAKLAADSGFHSEKNLEMLAEGEIDAYVADNRFRKRDPRFAEADRYKELQRQAKKCRRFGPKDFLYDKEKELCICPAGKKLYVKNRNFMVRGLRAIAFMGAKTECRVCSLRAQCLRHPERTEARQVYFFSGRGKDAEETFTQRMKRKIDSTLGRFYYSRRIAIVEPVFAHIRYTLGLNRFTLRSKRKVNTQWLLYCTLHNLFKVHRFAPANT
jgi:transposase